MKLSLAQVCQAVEGQLFGSDSYVQGVALDSKAVLPQQLFVAIKGNRVDGHDYLEEAKNRGAIAALVSHRVDCQLPQIVVSDTRVALGLLAKYYRQYLNMPIIALTGSCGKTTTTSLIVSILQQVGRVHFPPKSYNSDYGMPCTLLNACVDDDFVVLEFGANHQQEIAYLTDIAQPTIAMITNAGPVHIEGFGGLSGVVKGKGEIFQGLVEGGTAILNKDSPFFSDWSKSLQQKKLITFGLSENADVRAQNISVTADLSRFTLHINGEARVVDLKLLGAHNISNALAAAAAAVACQVPMNAIVQGLEMATAVDKRMVVRLGKHNTTVIDDSYNANPVAMEMAIRVLQHYQGAKILVVGDMGELGKEAEKYHQQLGQMAKSLGVDKLYAIGAFSKHVVSGFGTYGSSYESKSDLIVALNEVLSPGAAILIKGSRSAAMEEIVAAII